MRELLSLKLINTHGQIPRQSEQLPEYVDRTGLTLMRVDTDGTGSLCYGGISDVTVAGLALRQLYLYGTSRRQYIYEAIFLEEGFDDYDLNEVMNALETGLFTGFEYGGTIACPIMIGGNGGYLNRVIYHGKLEGRKASLWVDLGTRKAIGLVITRG